METMPLLRFELEDGRLSVFFTGGGGTRPYREYGVCVAGIETDAQLAAASARLARAARNTVRLLGDPGLVLEEGEEVCYQLVQRRPSVLSPGAA